MPTVIIPSTARPRRHPAGKRPQAPDLVCSATNRLFRSRIRVRHVADFTRQLAALVQARLSLTRALEILGSQCKHEQLKATIGDILAKVEDGMSFSSGLEKYPKVFSSFYVSLVRVGEQGGILEQTLSRCASYLEQITKLQRKLVTAFTYPTVIVLVAGGAITFMLAVVVPTFAEMFRDFGGELPAPTRVLLSCSGFLQHHLLLILTLSAFFGFALFRLAKTARGKYLFDKVQLKLPLVGMLLTKGFLARFCQTLGTLLNCGVPLLRSLDVSGTVTNNVILKEAIQNMKKRAMQGESILPPDNNSYPFTPLTTQMIHVGEETGELSQMLLQVAGFYEEELEATIDTMTSVIEPIIIVFLGVFLGGVLIAMYLQLFNLVNVIQ